VITADLKLDRESRVWLDHLHPTSPRYTGALEDLYDLLLKAARFEIGRRRASSPAPASGAEDLARQAAADALRGVIGKLGEFRGQSRFTTWAYKFALFEAANACRRHAWQDREVSLEPASWDLISDDRANVEHDFEVNERLTALGTAIQGDLTRHQRQVLVATTLNDVPIDVLAERLGTTRGALYKTIHDARRKLRTVLAARGLGLDEGIEKART
jgi:RNA polymerase sigma-70 factor (ECF subfamily)